MKEFKSCQPEDNVKYLEHNHDNVKSLVSEDIKYLSLWPGLIPRWIWCGCHGNIRSKGHGVFIDWVLLTWLLKKGINLSNVPRILSSSLLPCIYENHFIHIILWQCSMLCGIELCVWPYFMGLCFSPILLTAATYGSSTSIILVTLMCSYWCH